MLLGLLSFGLAGRLAVAGPGPEPDEVVGAVWGADFGVFAEFPPRLFGFRPVWGSQPNLAPPMA